MDDRLRNLVYGVALALMIGFILQAGSRVLTPVVIAMIVAYVVAAFARALSRIPRVGPAVGGPVRYTLAILTVAGLLVFVISLLIENIGQVVALAPAMQAKIFSIVQDYAVRYGFEAEPVWETIRRDVFGAVNLQALLRSTALSATTLVGGAFVVIVYAAFLLVERRMFERKLDRMSSDPAQTARLRRIVSSINDRIGEYLAAKTLINAILGVISWAVLFAAALPFGAFWAVLIAILNYIPYVGSVLGVAFPTAYALVFYPEANSVILLFLGLTAAQIFVGSVIEPRLLGQALNLSPFVILLAVTAWGAMWGITGALLAVPITASLAIVFSEFPGTRPIAVLMSRSGRIGHVHGEDEDEDEDADVKKTPAA